MVLLKLVLYILKIVIEIIYSLKCKQITRKDILRL